MLRDIRRVWITWTNMAVFDVEGPLVKVLSIGTDITEGQRTKKPLQRLSTFDSLTGISNRRAFDISLSEEWKRAQRGGYKISMMMIDVDQYTGTSGH